MLNKYTKILLDFKSIPQAEKKKTFMEITGYTYYENMSSNILQFFLDPNNEHGLKNLFLKALIKTANAEYNEGVDFKNVKVDREVITENYKRLDVLIQTDNYVIGIENKIFHYLHNDLAEYKALIDYYCTTTHQAKSPIYLVLTPKKLNNPNDLKKVQENCFINITYSELFYRIREEMGKYLNNTNLTYINYLIDFMQTINNLMPSNDEKELWNYFKLHARDIDKLRQSFNKYENTLYTKLNKLKGILEEKKIKLECENSGIWDKGVHCLFYNFKIKEYILTLDACIDIYGWQIWLSAPKDSEDFFLKNVISHPVFSTLKGKELSEIHHRKRIIIKKFEIDIEDNELALIADDLEVLLNILANFKNELEETTSTNN